MRRILVLLLLVLTSVSFGSPIGHLFYAANFTPRLTAFPGDITPYIQQASWNAQASSLAPNTGKPFNDTTAVIPIATATNASPGVFSPGTATLPYYAANAVKFSGGTGSWAALNGNTYYVSIAGQTAPSFALYTNVALSTPLDTSALGTINAGCTIQGVGFLDNNSATWQASGVTTANQTTDSGIAVQGGPVTSHTVTNGGSGYSGTPTVSLPAATDTKAIKGTTAGAPTAVVTTLVVTAVNPLLSGAAALGMGYLASPTDTFSGGGGTLAAAHGNALPSFAAQNGTLLQNGCSGWIYQTALGSVGRSDLSSIVNASTWKPAVFVRGRVANISTGLYFSSCYVLNVNQAGTVQVFYLDNFGSTSGLGDTPKAVTVLNHAGSAIPIGDTVSVSLRAVPVTVAGVASTQLYVKVVDTTASVTVYDDATPGTTQAPTTPRTDSVDGLGSATMQGICCLSGTMSAQTVTTYNPLGISCNPTGVTLGVSGQVVAVNGLGTAFTGTPFGMTAGATMTAQSLSSGTVGSITVTAGSTPGVSYVWDSTPADATAVSVSTTTGNAVSPIVVTPAVQTALQDGVPVVITGVGGNTAANTTAYVKITGQTAPAFALYSDAGLTMPIAGNGAYTSGGSIAVPPITPLSLQVILPPTAVPSLAAQGTVTVAASGPATFGDFTGSGVTYKLIRSNYANYPASGLAFVQIGASQTTTNSALTPTTIVDTPTLGGTYWYQWQATDNLGQTGYSVSVSVAIAGATPGASFGIFVESDSIGHGHGSIQPDLSWTLDMVVGAGDGNGSGTGYTPGVNAITIGPPQGGGVNAINATAAMFVDAGGVVRYAYATNQGYGYIFEGPGQASGGTLPTVTLPATAGTVATVVAGCGGGWPLYIQKYAWAWGYPNLPVCNASVGGSATGGWLPHGGMGASASNGVITTAFNSSLASNAPVTLHYTNADGTTGIINGFAGGTSGPTFTLYLNSGPTNPSTVTSSAAWITSADGSYTNGNAKYIREAAYASRAAIAPVSQIAVIGLGANDANGAVSQTKYQLQIGGMIEDALEHGLTKIFLEDPIYWLGTTQVNNQALGHDYPAALATLAAAIPGNVIHGGSANYATFVNMGLYAYSDTGLHPNIGGYGAMAGLIWKDVFPYLGIGTYGGGSHIIGG